MVLIRNFLFMAALLCISAPATAQSKSEPLQLAPTSKWQVDYAEDYCRLARKFGEGEQEVLAFFDRFGPTERFRMTLSGKPFKTSLNNTDATIQFGPDEEEQRIFFHMGELTKAVPALIFSGQFRVAPPTAAEKRTIDKLKEGEKFEVSSIDAARQTAIQYLKVGKPFRRPILLKTGPMRAPLAALDKCVDELLTHWGIDVEKHKSLTRDATPVGSPGQWIESHNYPLKMLHEGQPSIVEFRLIVGPDGKPTSCHIQLTTRPKEFDQAVCKSLMRRAKFQPALDAGGKPLASYWRSTVRFQIPSI